MSDQHDEGVSRRDREELSKLTRRREKVAKSDARERAARMRADGEAQLATIFQADDVRWGKAVEVAMLGDDRECGRISSQHEGQMSTMLGMGEEV